MYCEILILPKPRKQPSIKGFTHDEVKISFIKVCKSAITSILFQLISITFTYLTSELRQHAQVSKQNCRTQSEYSLENTTLLLCNVAELTTLPFLSLLLHFLFLFFPFSSFFSRSSKASQGGSLMKRWNITLKNVPTPTTTKAKY